MNENIALQGALASFVQETVRATVIELKEQGIIETQPEPLPDNTTFNLEEAAKLLDCSTTFVRSRLKSKEIHGFKSGGKWLIYKRELDKWIANGGSA